MRWDATALWATCVLLLLDQSAARTHRLVAPRPSSLVTVEVASGTSDFPSGFLAITFPCNVSVPRVVDAIKSHLRIWATGVYLLETGMRSNVSLHLDEYNPRMVGPAAAAVPFGAVICPDRTKTSTLMFPMDHPDYTNFPTRFSGLPGPCRSYDFDLNVTGTRYLSLFSRAFEECGPAFVQAIAPSLKQVESHFVFRMRALSEMVRRARPLAQRQTPRSTPNPTFQPLISAPSHPLFSFPSFISCLLLRCAQRIFNTLTFEPVEYASQAGQDVWVLERVYPDLPYGEGYFVELGGVDGYIMSNTYTLEKARGWRGVLIEASDEVLHIPESRSCHAVRALIGSRSGARHRFTVRGKQGLLSGVPEYLSSIREFDSEEDILRVAQGTAPVATRTLTEVLDEVQAPHFIHYVSIDVEGFEYEVLRGLDFTQYEVGAFTIEHNFQEPLRSDIRRHLTERGYELAGSAHMDDYYLHPRVAAAVRAREAERRARRGGADRRYGFGGFIDGDLFE